MAEVKKINLKKGRIVTKCGYTCHIYLPVELEGKEIVGLLVKEKGMYDD